MSDAKKYLSIFSTSVDAVGFNERTGNGERGRAVGSSETKDSHCGEPRWHK